MSTPHRSLLLLARLWVVVLMLVLTGRMLFFTTYRVSGASMIDALFDGDRILVAEAPFLVHPLANGDTVVLEVDNEVLVKRVIASPGDTIAMDGGRVERNGERLAEPIPPERNDRVTFPPYRMKAREYFVMGDNRRVSVDSRDFGPVIESQMLGKVYLRFGSEGIERVKALEGLPTLEGLALDDATPRVVPTPASR